jgi:hypothetical protein
MSKQAGLKVSRAGAFVVRAAESPSTRVPSKPMRSSQTPRTSDKSLVHAVLKHKSSG